MNSSLPGHSLLPPPKAAADVAAAAQGVAQVLVLVGAQDVVHVVAMQLLRQLRFRTYRPTPTLKPITLLLLADEAVPEEEEPHLRRQKHRSRLLSRKLLPSASFGLQKTSAIQSSTPTVCRNPTVESASSSQRTAVSACGAICGSPRLR